MSIENKGSSWAQGLVDNLNRNVKKDSKKLETFEARIIENNLRIKKDQQLKLTQQTSWAVILGVMLIIFVSSYSGSAKSQIINFNNSPNNWVNSPNNWDNSPNNFNNSPNNFNNSPNNFSATNGVYDNRGNRIGYEVPAPSGVINYFDNSGNRIGYKPTGR